MKYNGCDAKGEMFKGENDEWLFVLHGSGNHNHLPDDDQSNDIHKFEYKSTDD